MNSTRLQGYREEIIGCHREHCGFCLQRCPVFEAKEGFLVYGGRGKIDIAYEILSGSIEYTNALATCLYACTTCGYCKVRCGAVDVVAIIETMREQAVMEGKGLEKHLNFGAHIRGEKNPYFELHSERFAWLPEDIEPLTEKCELVYFVGCTSAYRSNEIAQATLKILRASGIEFGVMNGEEWCCGSPLLRTGQRNLAEQMAKHNIEAIKRAGAQRIVTSCAGCYRTFKLDYPRVLGLDLEFDVMHAMELLGDLLSNGKLDLNKDFRRKVTYHDPCHLSRHAGVLELPREILKSVPGVEFREMHLNREDARCCGAGGGVKSAFHDLASTIAKKRLEDAKEVEADTIVTACPFCYLNLREAIKASDTNLDILDMIQLAAKTSS